jgi:hypothetical protein
MRPYVATDSNAALHELRVLESTAESCMSSSQVAELASEAERLVEPARTELAGPSLEAVEAEAARVRSALEWRVLKAKARARAHSPNG